MKSRRVSMWSSRFSGPRAFRSTRRTATVTISAPEATWASSIASKLGYFPVPTMRRDRNSRPARMKGSPLMLTMVARAAGGPCLAPAHERHDLEPVAVVQAQRGVLGAGHDAQVVLDRHPRPVEGELAQHVGHRRAGRHPQRFPVHGNLDAPGLGHAAAI